MVVPMKPAPRIPIFMRVPSASLQDHQEEEAASCGKGL